jgi:hypothetical protein
LWPKPYAVRLALSKFPAEQAAEDSTRVVRAVRVSSHPWEDARLDTAR